MIFEKARIIEYDNSEEYVTVSIIKDNDKEYAFANKLNENEPIEEYRIFTILDDKLTVVEDNNLINKLLPIFQKEIEKDLKEILNDK